MSALNSLTLVLNPNARGPRLRPPSIEEIEKLLGPKCTTHLTRNLDELDQLMSTWKGRDDQETLCFYGGDGSIARGLTSLIRHRGENAELPPVLAVRAGTINMICSVLNLREEVRKTLSDWGHRRLPALKSIPLLKIEFDGRPPQYGFVFAWGLGYRALRKYYDRGQGAPTAFDGMMVFTKALFAALHPRAAQKPMYRRENVDFLVDGEHVRLDGMLSLAVGTISRVSLGIRPFPPDPIEPGGFHFSANGMSLPRIVRHTPSLFYGVGDQRELARAGQRLAARSAVKTLECELSEGFTMDGEMFEIPGRTRVRVSAGPIVRFWTRDIA